MNPASNIIPQNDGNLTQQQPKRLPGSTERIFTAIVQLFCGFFAVFCGVAIILLKPRTNFNDLERYRYYIGDEDYKLERFENTKFGIWGGLVFIATAIPYFFGRNKKCMVGLYFGLCLASAVIAAGGIGLSVAAINRITYYTSGEACFGADWQLRDKNPCCFYKYYDCNQLDGYVDFYSFMQSSQDYNSLECELKRELSRDTINDCRHEARQLYVSQLMVYGILIATVSVELFASLYGASAALMAFCSCKCCCGRQNTPRYTCSSNRSVVNDGCNIFTVFPTVAFQHPEPETINTTQIPQISRPQYVSPQRLLGRPQNTMYGIPNM